MALKVVSKAPRCTDNNMAALDQLALFLAWIHAADTRDNTRTGMLI